MYYFGYKCSKSLLFRQLFVQMLNGCQLLTFGNTNAQLNKQSSAVDCCFKPVFFVNREQEMVKKKGRNHPNYGIAGEKAEMDDFREFKRDKKRRFLKPTPTNSLPSLLIYYATAVRGLGGVKGAV